MISVATRGDNLEEGIMLDLSVGKLIYFENRALAATYVASLYLKGGGTVKLLIKKSNGEAQGERVYETLNLEWKRCSVWLCFKDAFYKIGPKGEQDWKSFLPPVTNVETKLEFYVLTRDQGKLQFFVDGFQIEPSYLHYANTGGASPHTWIPSKMKVRNDYFVLFETWLDSFEDFKKNGSISFWIKPLLDARDSTLDVILNLVPNALRLQHSSSTLVMSPAGVSYRPFDFKNEWHHIVIIWDEAGERNLYVDSMEYLNQSGEKAPTKSLQHFYLGDGGNAAPNAVIDDLILFQCTLAQEQVQQVAQWRNAPSHNGGIRKEAGDIALSSEFSDKQKVAAMGNTK